MRSYVPKGTLSDLQLIVKFCIMIYALGRIVLSLLIWSGRGAANIG